MILQVTTDKLKNRKRMLDTHFESCKAAQAVKMNTKIAVFLMVVALLQTKAESK